MIINLFRKIIYRIVEFTARSNFFVKIIAFIKKPFSIINNIFDLIVYKNQDLRDIKTLSKLISKENIVIQGIFKGLKFANASAVGSAYLPKILGSYEIELLPVLNSLIKNKFEVIIDIGCAEGYYAVGLARLFRKNKIYAFDVDPIARKQCNKNSIINGVQNNLEIARLCDSDFLNKKCNNKHSLVICDIEGAEKKLFKNIDVSCLIKSFLLIEIHDGVDKTISNTIKEKFKQTHDLEIYYSTDDIYRPEIYKKLNIVKLNNDQLFIAMKEKRLHIMRWFYFIPKI